MQVNNAIRQVNEIQNIIDRFNLTNDHDDSEHIYKNYDDMPVLEISTPTLYSRLQRSVQSIHNSANQNQELSVKKCLSFTIRYAGIYPDYSDEELSKLVLDVIFPLDYPSESTCLVKAMSSTPFPHDHTNDNSTDSNDQDTSEYKSCTTAIQEYLEGFHGCECIELVLDWLEEHKDTCLIMNSCTTNNSKNTSSIQTFNPDSDKLTCCILRYNHLLSGPEHKKEKSMMDTAKKSKLQGGLYWGTPGIVIVVPPSTQEDAQEYGSECRTIGKRPTSAVEEVWLSIKGIEEAGLGGLAQQKRGGRLQELDTDRLRTVCGGDDDLMRVVLGVQ